MKWNITVNETQDPEIVCSWSGKNDEQVGEFAELSSAITARGYAFSAEEIGWQIEALDHGFKVQQVKDGRYMFSPISIGNNYILRFGVDPEARSFRT